MIARIWRGAVRASDADAYGAYIGETGLAEYVRTPGNRGAWMLRRDVGELTEFLTFTFWESLDAVKAFAGEDDLCGYPHKSAYADSRVMPRPSRDSPYPRLDRGRDSA